jgi:SAM-dependent methyltransferase
MTGTGLIAWLQQNSPSVDWQIFAEPWDEMQLRHNPYRTEQIQQVISHSALDASDALTVLDLGCGPGGLGRCIRKDHPQAAYYAADGDPLMLAAMRKLVSGGDVVPILQDIREPGWSLQYQDHFNCVVSLTALHWLSQERLRALYRQVYGLLKVGGTVVVGDPYLPETEHDRKRLAEIQTRDCANQRGKTWNEFWEDFWRNYHAKDLHDEYLRESSAGDLWEGSDDGYRLDFYVRGLSDAGFKRVEVFWTKGLRVVYGARK